MKKLLVAAGACAMLVAGNIAANANPYIVTLQEVGSNVVATGSGEFDLTGLTFDAEFSPAAANVTPGAGFIATGSSGDIDGYTGFTGPVSFGSGGQTFANSASGDNVQIIGDAAPEGETILWVPTGYVSGNALSDSATYDGATFATLGLTTGSYVWTWGSDADQNFTLDIVAPTATPLPAAFPLFAGGLGMLGFLTRRKKRNAAAIVAA